MRTLVPHPTDTLCPSPDRLRGVKNRGNSSPSPLGAGDGWNRPNSSLFPLGLVSAVVTSASPLSSMGCGTRSRPLGEGGRGSRHVIEVTRRCTLRPEQPVTSWTSSAYYCSLYFSACQETRRVFRRFRHWQWIPAFAGMTTPGTGALNLVIPAKAGIHCSRRVSV